MLKWLLSFFGFKPKKVEVEKERFEPKVSRDDFCTPQRAREMQARQDFNLREESVPEHQHKTYMMPRRARSVETMRTSAAKPNPPSRPSSGATPSRVHDDHFYLNQAMLHSSVIDDTPPRRNDVCEPTRSYESPSRNDSYDTSPSYDSPSSPCD